MIRQEELLTGGGRGDRRRQSWRVVGNRRRTISRDFTHAWRCWNSCLKVHDLKVCMWGTYCMGEVILTLFSKNWEPIKGFWVREARGEQSLRRIKLAIWGFPGGSDSKQSACNAGDPGSVLELRRSPGEGHGYPLQHSCLENPRDRGAWRAAAHRGAEGQTRLGA